MASCGRRPPRGIPGTPAHMLSDAPNQFQILIERPAEVEAFLSPDRNGRRERRPGGRQENLRAAGGRSRGRVPGSGRAFPDAPAATLRIRTPGARARSGLRMGHGLAAYDNLFAQSRPGLGDGRWLGMSGTGGRPGFGWFFGGDAFLNSFSLVRYGPGPAESRLYSPGNGSGRMARWPTSRPRPPATPKWF